MKALIAALILTALTLATLIVAPLFPQSAPAFNDGIAGRKDIAKYPDVNIRFPVRRDARIDKF